MAPSRAMGCGLEPSRPDHSYFLKPVEQRIGLREANWSQRGTRSTPYMCGRIGAGSLVHGRDLHIRRGDIRRAPGRGDSSIRPATVVCNVAAVPPTTTTKPKPAPTR